MKAIRLLILCVIGICLAFLVDDAFSQNPSPGLGSGG